MVALGVAAAVTSSGSLSDPELLSIRLERVDLAALLRAFAAPRVASTRRAADASPATRPGCARRSRTSSRTGSGTGRRRPSTCGREDGLVVVVGRATTGRASTRQSTRSPAGVSAAGSTGYGLWLARAIAEAHGGRWSSARRPARGACFRLSLPLFFRARLTPSSRCERLRAGAPRRGASRGLEHDGLARVGEHLGEQPFLGLERQVRERGLVGQRACAALELPARDDRRVPERARGAAR